MEKEGDVSTHNYFTFSSWPVDSILSEFSSSTHGLSSEDASQRLAKYGLNKPAKDENASFFAQLAEKFTNPLIIILVVIVLLSLFFGEKISAIFIALMIVISVGMDMFQESRSATAVKSLNALIHNKACVIRDGQSLRVDVSTLVPGDIVTLSVGDIVPADIRLIETKDISINQSSLTGESFPVLKVVVSKLKSQTSLTERAQISSQTVHKSVIGLDNIVFMGSHVVSGSATGIVVTTGSHTQFGEISKHIAGQKEKTAFDRGIDQFTMLMVKSIIFLVIGIFMVVTLFKHGSVKEALLFSLAVAVGLTPEMLPMMVAINLSKGAQLMASKKVIVRRLDAIQNFGAMDVLCTDKTGTLTRDEIILKQHCSIDGAESAVVFKYTYLNSALQTGIRNVLDYAVLKHDDIHDNMRDNIDIRAYTKVDEIPFDFERKILSIVVSSKHEQLLIAKGAPEEIFKRCSTYVLRGKSHTLTSQKLSKIVGQYHDLSSKGFRVLAIATKKVSSSQIKAGFSVKDESHLELHGFATFLDPAKETTGETLASLQQRGITVKILTGDNEFVTQKICQDVGLVSSGSITGLELDSISDVDLPSVVKTHTIFARLSPLQKERVVRALQKSGHVVGFMGDGINDAPALKAADVGISVNNAVDIAKESADIILLEKSLGVLNDGVMEGRRTFGNIVKYVKMGASSNFGNMLSMAGATIFLPFLPMLPIQVLLNNFLYDLSNVSLPTDSVDDSYIEKPKPWRVDFIRLFMMYVGPISSIFDFVTFGVMWFVFGGSTMTPAAIALFHTGWFIESLFTQTLIIYVIRTNKIPFIESRPSKYLVLTTLIVLTVAIGITFSPLRDFFSFAVLPPLYFAILAVMILTYMALVHVVKTWLLKKYPAL